MGLITSNLKYALDYAMAGISGKAEAVRRREVGIRNAEEAVETRVTAHTEGRRAVEGKPSNLEEYLPLQRGRV
jgi:hypothetical protein